MQTAIELEVNGLTLRGMLHRPEGSARCPMVVVYHGFTGQKTEPHFIFVKLSRALAAAGLASVRFDFSGSGESDGDFAAMTFGGEVAEAKAILDYARTLPFVNPARVFLLGLSMGGAIAGVVAGDEADKVRAVVLWAPAGNMPELIAARLTPDVRSVLDAQGRIDIGGHWLSKEFCDELAGIDIHGRAARFPGRVLLLHGEADATVPPSASMRYKEIYGDRAELHLLPGADHTFNRKDWEDEVIRRTVAFIAEESGATPWP